MNRNAGGIICTIGFNKSYLVFKKKSEKSLFEVFLLFWVRNGIFEKTVMDIFPTKVLCRCFVCSCLANTLLFWNKDIFTMKTKNMQLL